MIVLLFYKPYDVLTRFTDEQHRPTLADFISVPDVYPAGRLDKDSEGLLILTDDGALQSQITHPRNKLPKTYLAQVERIPDTQAIQQLQQGVELKGRRTRPAQVELLTNEPDVPPGKPIRYRKSVPTAWLRLTITEGRNRQVRRMTAAVGHPTLRLVRVAIGLLTLGELKPGEWRELTPKEVASLRKGW